MSFNSTSCPKLRWPLDIQHIEHQGEKLIVLVDPADIATEPLVLIQACLPIIGRFDGENSLSQIAQEGSEFGVTLEILCELASMLDSKLFLESDNSRAKAKLLRDGFANSDFREASHAGLVYPRDPEQLKKTLNDYIGKSADISLPQTKAPVAFIAPHIDYNRGWKTYGAGFKALQNLKNSDVIFLLGTSHAPSAGIFHLTRKDFDTPLGRVKANVEVINQLAKKFGEKRSFAEEILHKKEHSLELQMPFIAHCFSGSDAPTIVPILVGSFYDYLRRGELPDERGEAAEFIGSLSEVCRELKSSGKNVLFYGGVDLAHVGTHFGDKTRISDSGLGRLEKRDLELMDCVLAADEKGLFEHIAQDMDQRRICGFPSMYTMLSAMKKAGISHKGELIEYRQAVEPKTDCVVTFASACWFEV